MEMTRAWRPDWPCPVGAVWSNWRRGAGDPTYRIVSGRHWRGLPTPAGPATLAVEVRPSEGVVDAHAWGPGAAWALDQLPTLLGAHDDPSGLRPVHQALRHAAHTLPHWRVGRGGIVWQALVPAIIEQKVTGQEAFAGYRRLVRRHGEPAPGPGTALDLWVLPSPDVVQAIPSWEWLQLGIDAGRSAPLVRAARVAGSLERLAGASWGSGTEATALERGLRSLPGIGIWTAAEVRSRALGDADAVAFGDYHVARNIGWALLGRDIDDTELAKLLEPYRGHRYRVQRLLELCGAAHPRHGARLAPRAHLPVR